VEKLQKMKTEPSGVFLDRGMKNTFYFGESAIATAAAVKFFPHF